MKLTKREKEIVDKMLNGWMLITTEHVAFLSKGYENDNTQLALFFRMVNKDIIYQELQSPFNYKFHPCFLQQLNQQS